MSESAERFGSQAREHAEVLASTGVNAAQTFLERIRTETNAIQTTLSELLEHGERMSVAHRNQTADLAGASQNAAERAEEMRSALADQARRPSTPARRRSAAPPPPATIWWSAARRRTTALVAHLADLTQRVPSLMHAQAEGIRQASEAAAQSATLLHETLQRQNRDLADALEQTNNATQIAKRRWQRRSAR